MLDNIIGRKEEKQILQTILHSRRSEFISVCGRRRVGKTFLIKEFFEEHLVFQTSGLANSGMNAQISAFSNELIIRGMSIGHAKTWMDMFFLLRQYLESLGDKRKVILLDELPWFDTPRSGFIAALEYFWNVWASSRHDVVLIVCGSATSWMMDKLINSHGGLHNRLTYRLFLQPFSLGECEQFFKSRGFHVSRYETAEYYMILGGTPYYLEMLNPGLSMAQNIDNLFFRDNALLANEFNNLYAALFKNSDDYMKVVRQLSKRRDGMQRKEIMEACHFTTGGGLSTILANLESCGFIRKYDSFDAKHTGSTLYQLLDFFTFFHFRFLSEKKKGRQWTALQQTAEFYSWAGISFELLALSHVRQIKQRLGISGVQTMEYAWRGQDEEGRAQIDLVIDRTDRTANICEMKFSLDSFEITKEYDANLRHKIEAFMKQTKMRKSAVLTMITTYGVKPGKYSGLVQSEIKLDDLFDDVYTIAGY